MPRPLPTLAGLTLALSIACVGGDQAPPPVGAAPATPGEAPPPVGAAPATPGEAPLPLGPAVAYDLAAPRTVVDLYMALPTAHLDATFFGPDGALRQELLRGHDVDPATRVRHTLPSREIDLGNGWLRFATTGDGEGSIHTFVVWKLPDDARLLGVADTTWSMCGESSRVRFLRYDGGWTDVTDTAWPKIGWEAFLSAPTPAEALSTVLALPRQGKDVLVTLDSCVVEALAEGGRVVATPQITARWTGEGFEIR